MRAGDLRNRVELQEKQVTKSARGAELVTWTTVAHLWAAIDPLSGRESLDGKQEQSEIIHRMRIRYRPETVAVNRIKWGARLFDIQAVTHTQERRRETVLTLREVVIYA
jgi:SPP1 family predicted phage head-tail adaptor